jgi:hypothetical protein
MSFDSYRADEEQPGDLFIGPTLRHQVKDLFFSAR